MGAKNFPNTEDKPLLKEKEVKTLKETVDKLEESTVNFGQLQSM